MKRLAVDIWSDIACPWCYVGKRRFEAALRRFAARDAVDVTWRSFELDREAPRVHVGTRSYAQRLATKYRTSVEQAAQMIRQMTDTAAEAGIVMRFDRVQPGNTFDAHRLIHMAAAAGAGDAAKERLLRAYFTDGEAIGERDVLVRIAVDVGLEADATVAMLAGDTYAADVRADEAEAGALGIHGVPCFVFGGRYGVSGAQPPDALLHVLERVWRETPELTPAADGPACGPDGC